MIEHIKDDIRYLSFSKIDRIPGMRNVFTTRYGGVSTGCYASMNLGFSNGDDPELVTRNFEIISDILGVNPDHIVCSKQTHTTNVVRVTEKDCGNDGKIVPNRFSDVDGLMTDVPGIALACFFADCVPLFFADPVKRVVAVSHSGWRGTVARMGAVTVRRMNEEYGCKPEDIITSIGPSICPECYEVSEDVAQAFKDEFGSKSNMILSAGKEEGKYQLDLWTANEIILQECGIIPGHITFSQLCTCCNSERLFSHRASGGKRGNLAAFIELI